MEFAKRGGTDSRYYSSAGEDDDRRPVKKLHMFNKMVTPSDVGKLNRLVIPKQLAEKYLPAVSSKNEKGLLLNFEDRNGKPWIFRYSYWNSSQTYVMTKGWIRFVKEKQLGAGDTVSFGRGVGEAAHDDLLYIDWINRRPETRTKTPIDVIPRRPLQSTYNNPTMSSVQPWNHLYTSPASAYDHDGHGPYGNGRYSFLYLTSSVGGSPTHSNLGHDVGDGFQRSSTIVFESAAMRHSSVTLSSSSSSKNTKFVRLFGVNLDCSSSSSSPALSLQLSLGDPGASTPDMV